MSTPSSSCSADSVNDRGRQKEGEQDKHVIELYYQPAMMVSILSMWALHLNEMYETQNWIFMWSLNR